MATRNARARPAADGGSGVYEDHSAAYAGAATGLFQGLRPTIGRVRRAGHATAVGGALPPGTDTAVRDADGLVRRHDQSTGSPGESGSDRALAESRGSARHAGLADRG